MNLDNLDEASASFARALFAKWPSWRGFAVVEGEPARFGLQLPDPAGSHLECPLFVSAAGDEITVGMDTYHRHFPWPPAIDEFSGEMADAIEFVELLIEERAAILTHVSGDQSAGSGVLSLEDYRAGVFRKRPDSNVSGFRIRSWRGSLDVDGDCSA